jgi:hypothetical protein
MLKIKMIEILSGKDALNKIADINSFNISIQFKFKVCILIEDLNKYLIQYSKQLQELIKEYDVEITDNQFKNKDKDKLKMFLDKQYDLDNMDIEINQDKIMFDKNINTISANELLILKPFFDYSELK